MWKFFAIALSWKYASYGHRNVVIQWCTWVRGSLGKHGGLGSRDNNGKERVAWRVGPHTFYNWQWIVIVWLSKSGGLPGQLVKTSTEYPTAPIPLYWGRIKFLGTSNVSHTLVYGMIDGSKGSMVAWLVGKVVKMYRLNLPCCFLL